MHKERRCIGCNITKDASCMIKITKDYKTNEIIVNPTNKTIGRSVYICKDESCINIALRKNRIEKNLKTNLTETEKDNIKILLNNMLVVKH